MKKTKILVLPLMSLLLTSCATSIKGSDMPTLAKDPGYLLKLTASSSFSGDKDIIEDMGLTVSTNELSLEVYTNFVKLVSKEKEDGKTVTTTMYVMIKNDVSYVLEDKDGDKSKTEVPDPTGLGFKAGSAVAISAAEMFVVPALGLYLEMSSFEPSEDKSDDYSLKRSGNTYIYAGSETEGEFKVDNVGKITLKDDYFSGLEITSVINRDNKKATNKISVKYTFGPDKESYSESKMPKPADYA